MRSPLKYQLFCLIVSGCAGLETVVVSKYFIENHMIPAVSSAIEVVVPTDDPIHPYKILYIGSTTERATIRALRSPDDIVASRSGYSYWDYCYSQGNKIALNISRRRQECNSLRLYFDNNGILYDHAHVVKAYYTGITKNLNRP